MSAGRLQEVKPFVLIDLALAKTKPRCKNLGILKKNSEKGSELIIQEARDNVRFGNAVKKEGTLRAGKDQHACWEGKPLK